MGEHTALNRNPLHVLSIPLVSRHLVPCNRIPFYTAFHFVVSSGCRFLVYLYAIPAAAYIGRLDMDSTSVR